MAEGYERDTHHDEMRELLTDMVREINVNNASDMMEGYMNDFADMFNDRLHMLGLPLVEKINVDDDEEFPEVRISI